MHVYHEWDANGKHYKAVYDEAYETIGSYAYDTEEETKAAEDEEIAKLNSGEWIALGVIVSEPCKGLVEHKPPTEEGERDEIMEAHCECCSGRKETDSLWGIVVEASEKAIEELVKGEGL